MKTIFFTIVILFSFSTISAQETTNQNTTTVKASKLDFYNALIKANNFDITIKENKKEVTNTTKKDFYNLLLEKNGFNTDTQKTTRLTNLLDKKENTKITQKNATASLLP
ncbi:hypothetical protein SAMN04487910_1107 [Aquimarina amphilecti]|uniref:Uncharacterized protein n=1 Tax=Aquimarina amphilecti TaxID=1038014 RepID=A0A1H7JUT9_AQUAM|nr:hypothetical protein [Aquimarina amphilecti]SEK78292.1 hypothetical protein SAMN04487910_1107 [Aquimarina amphilecti]